MPPANTILVLHSRHSADRKTSQGTHSFLELVLGLPLLLESTQSPVAGVLRGQAVDPLALPSDDAPAAFRAALAHLLLGAGKEVESVEAALE